MFNPEFGVDPNDLQNKPDIKEVDIDKERALQIGLETEKNLQLAEQVVLELTNKNLHITTVESCTGGGLAYYITNIPGASDVLMDSFVTYSNEAKIALGVPAETIDEHTVYSRETAQAMAEAGLKKSVHADVGVGITGSISRVDPNNPNSTPGTIYLAVTYEGKTATKVLDISANGRFDVKQKIIGEALQTVLESITSNSISKQ